MKTFRITLRLLSALGTPLAGDTLFGQLCWILRRQHGNERLNSLLQGYTERQPFAVISDALPHGHLPLPSLPPDTWQVSDNSDRKALKKKRWLPLSALRQPFSEWQRSATTDVDLGESREHPQPHNTINRQTGTTGTGMFAPYTVAQIWLKPGSELDLWLVLDTERITPVEIHDAFVFMGWQGYGRDASIGLGKFELQGELQAQPHIEVSDVPNAYLTLGPCAPQGQGFCPQRSYWNIVPRFGRHGDLAVQSGQPFKRPVLLAKAGSVFWPEHADAACTHIGQGLGGIAAPMPISVVMPETVQQGYCPVVPIHIPEKRAFSETAGASE
ncbi:MAG: CRISPR-associated protein Csm7 [Betaproteobacteria bacterium]|jgi:CRISPR-associated protein Csm4|nr:CRISPR-associated protein Csm7 [Betaproteobacteria bacterium]